MKSDAEIGRLLEDQLREGMAIVRHARCGLPDPDSEHVDQLADLLLFAYLAGSVEALEDAAKLMDLADGRSSKVMADCIRSLKPKARKR